MTDIILNGCEPHTLLSHLAAYGLAAILETQGAAQVQIGWTTGANPRPYVAAPSADDAATLVAAHAQAASVEGSWTNRDVTLKGSPRGLMSPRLTPFGDAGTWTYVQQMRQEVLDDLTAKGALLDLMLIAALGEPCYWRRNKQGVILQDDGASRLEMQPRNRGSEFVGNRLRKLAGAVAAREPAQILSGLRGEAVRDEIGSDKPDSRTATGLAGLGPTDNALAWCALWGISQFPVVMRARATALTTGHFGRSRSEWFYVPIWNQRWQPARLRSILASEYVRALATTGQGDHSSASGAEVEVARRWLAARGVVGVIRFPIARFNSDSASERRAMRGEPIPAGAPG